MNSKLRRWILYIVAVLFFTSIAVAATYKMNIGSFQRDEPGATDYMNIGADQRDNPQTTPSQLIIVTGEE